MTALSGRKLNGERDCKRDQNLFVLFVLTGTKNGAVPGVYRACVRGETRTQLSEQLDKCEVGCGTKNVDCVAEMDNQVMGSGFALELNSGFGTKFPCLNSQF